MGLVWPDDQVTNQHLSAKLLKSACHGTVPNERLVGVDVDETSVARDVLEGVVVLIVLPLKHLEQGSLDPVTSIEQVHR